LAGFNTIFFYNLAVAYFFGLPWPHILTTRVQNAEKFGGSGQTAVAEHGSAGVDTTSTTAVALVNDCLQDTAQTTSCHTHTPCSTSQHRQK